MKRNKKKKCEPKPIISRSGNWVFTTLGEHVSIQDLNSGESYSYDEPNKNVHVLENYKDYQREQWKKGMNNWRFVEDVK